MKVLHAVACPIDFKLLYAQGQLGGVLKPMENGHFLVFLTVWIILPKF